MAAFKASSFRSKLSALSDSAQSIQTLSHWVCYHRKACQESALIWAEEALKAPADRHLLFMYLANDIMQNSRRKTLDFVKSYAAQLMDVFPKCHAVASEKVQGKLVRMLNIWEERRVLPSDQVNELRRKISGVMEVAPVVETSFAQGAHSGALGDKSMRLQEYLSQLNEVGALEEDKVRITSAMQSESALLQQRIRQLKEELSARQQLVLLLASTCEKQDYRIGLLRAAIEELSSFLVGTQTADCVPASADGTLSPGLEQNVGSYSPSDH
ncbi:hypothetical protein AB1Y20_007121 [Prymnesium parvum]